MQVGKIIYVKEALALFSEFGNNEKMREKNSDLMEKVGKRVQGCYGCFIPYHFKDMYLGEDVTFFCEHCKDETMFHFNEFSQFLDLEKVREAEENY